MRGLAAPLTKLIIFVVVTVLATGLLAASIANLGGGGGTTRDCLELIHQGEKSGARVALFGARDVWFVVGVPVFLYSVGWTFTMVGGFLAAWTIGYGLVQALAPQLVRRSADGLSREVPAAQWWSAVLTLIPLAIAAALWLQAPQLQWWVVGGLSLFGFAFAINSSVHSYLILAYAGSEKAAEDVGFYYAANALGRFMGTLLSGLLYQWGGLMYALLGSALMLLLCWLATLRLPMGLRNSFGIGP